MSKQKTYMYIFQILVFSSKSFTEKNEPYSNLVNYYKALDLKF